MEDIVMNAKERQRFIEELEVRALDEHTRKAYTGSLEKFFGYHRGKSAESLCVEEIKEFQRHLLKENYAANSINRHLSAVRFFYRFVYGRHWYTDALPRLKSPQLQPAVLSKDEVALMIQSVRKTFYKAILMTLYSTGMRQNELRNLKITDIDSKRMVITIRGGKGQKDRQALLSQANLECLRKYWREDRLKQKVKSEWLFMPTKNPHNGKIDKQLSHTAIGYIVDLAASVAGIKKKLLPTRFATPLRSTF
jgi:integrase/recombinase XerD